MQQSVCKRLTANAREANMDLKANNVQMSLDFLLFHADTLFP